jgi:hypothetical protein
MIVEADTFGAARLSIDPTAAPGPDATTLTLLATEHACASGQPPDGRKIVTTVTETEADVSILVLVEGMGMATCPSNPPFPVTVQLDQPLGSRQILDGSTLPGRPVEPAAGG